MPYLLWGVGALIIAAVFRFVFVLYRRRVTAARFHVRKEACIVGFYHPFCASGGGGERVLWKIVHTLGVLHSRGAINLHVVIYAAGTTGKITDGGSLLRSAQERFGIDLGNCQGQPPISGRAPSTMPIEVVFLPAWAVRLVQPEAWPRFTMLGQSLGSVILAFLGLLRATPHTFIDTTGAAFTMPLARFFGARCACYVHYPTISVDMLQVVASGQDTYNHKHGSLLRASLKCVYYCAFAALYCAAGSAADLVLVNSSWTRAHIASLWRLSPAPLVVYPPVGVEDFTGGGGAPETPPVVISVAQFRPEKDHALQLRAFRALLDLGLPAGCGQVRLALLGSCRDQGDEARVAALRALAAELGIQDRVDFLLNVPFSGVVKALGAATVGIHTMWNEHFGIGVVEMMAAGLVVVAHDSAGPKGDIVRPALRVDASGPGNGPSRPPPGARGSESTGESRGESRGEACDAVGFLAHDVPSYARALGRALALHPADRAALVARAKAQALRFSDGVFADALEVAVASNPRLFRA